jgi:hypothetical protein
VSLFWLWQLTHLDPRDDFAELLRATLTTFGLPYEKMGEKSMPVL